MRITIELDQADVEQFAASMDRSRALAQSMDETDVIDGAKQTLDSRSFASAPAYVRNRIVGVQQLIMMLEDDAWALPNPERGDVLAALVYFSDPDDLIPDDVEVIGLFDDAVVLELVLRRLRHVRCAYAEFCVFREQMNHATGALPSRLQTASKLARQRDALCARMQRHTLRVRAKQQGNG